MKATLHKLLKMSEKYTKTDMIYLAKGGFWLTLGHGIAVSSSFLLAIAFANLISKEAYGMYKYILSIAGIVMALSVTGFKTAVVQAVARGFEGILQQAFWINLKWGAVMIAASLLASCYYVINNNYALAISFLIIGFFSPLLSSAGLYSTFLNGKKDFKTITVYGTINNLVPAISLFVTLLLTHNPVVLVFVYFLSNTVIELLLYGMTLRKYRPNTNTDATAIQYSKHLSIMNVLTAISAYIDRVLVFHYLGAAQLAVYTFATAIPDQIKTLFLKNIGSLSLPKFSEKSMGEIKKSIFNKILKAVLVMLAITVCYLIAAPIIFKLLFPRYLESVVYSQLFSLSLVAVLAFVPVSILQSQNMTRELYQFNVSTSILQIVLLFMLTSSYGILGAITAQLISRFFNLFLSLILVKYAKS